MTKSIFILSFLLVCTLCACNREEEPTLIIEPELSLECDAFITAMEALDNVALKGMLDPELANFTLLDLDNDACPYSRNLDGFIEFLNGLCDELDATVFCCVCIETFPTESEISVRFNFDGEEVIRVLDLASPLVEGDPLTFSGVHE